MGRAGGRHSLVGRSEALALARSVFVVLALAMSAPEYPKTLLDIENEREPGRAVDALPIMEHTRHRVGSGRRAVRRPTAAVA